MRTKLSLALRCGLLVLALTGGAKAETEQVAVSSTRGSGREQIDRRGRFASIYLGLDYALFAQGDTTRNLKFSTIAQGAYQLKVAEIRFHDLWGVEALASYSTSRLLEAAGFRSREALEADVPTEAQAILGLLRFAIARRVRLETSISLSRFDARGKVSDSNSPIPYVSGGDSSDALIHQGQRINWTTNRIEFSALLRINSADDRTSYFLGYSYFDVTMLQNVTLKRSEDLLFDALVNNRNRCHAFSMGMGENSTRPRLGLSPLFNMFFHLGVGKMDNALFEGNNVCVGVSLEVGARFTGESLGIDIGYTNTGVVFSNDIGSAELRRNVGYINGGSPRSARAGSRWDVNLGSAATSYLGPFLRLSYAF